MKAQDLGIDSKTFQLKYMRVSAQSQGVSTSARKEKVPIRDGWDKYVKDFSENPATPEGLRSVYQEAGVFWAWMESEYAFFEGVRTGVAISGILAFVILLVATRNLLVSLYALITVIFIVLCVISMMVLNDW